MLTRPLAVTTETRLVTTGGGTITVVKTGPVILDTAPTGTLTMFRTVWTPGTGGRLTSCTTWETTDGSKGWLAVRTSVVGTATVVCGAPNKNVLIVAIQFPLVVVSVTVLPRGTLGDVVSVTVLPRGTLGDAVIVIAVGIVAPGLSVTVLIMVV